MIASRQKGKSFCPQRPNSAPGSASPGGKHRHFGEVSPIRPYPTGIEADLIAEARRLCLDDVPLTAIAGEVFRLADTAGYILLNPDTAVLRWLGCKGEAVRP